MALELRLMARGTVAYLLPKRSKTTMIFYKLREQTRPIGQGRWKGHGREKEGGNKFGKMLARLQNLLYL